MNAPKLRFKNAEGADFPLWTMSKLGDEVQFSKGGKLGKNDLQKEGSHQCLLYGELYTSYGSIASKIFSRTDADSDTTSQKYDVVMPTSGETAEDIATATCIPFDGILYGGDLIILRSQTLYGPFLSYQINSSLKRKISRVAQGKSVVHIGAEKIKPISFSFPCQEEQQKLASFFSTLDQKIELNERKLEALERLKKGLMQKIFDHEIRFKSDDGGTYSSWNESSLGNYFSVKMCKRIFKEETSDVGEVPFFKIGTFGKTPDAYISKELFEKYKKNFNYPSINDTLISCSGTVGRCVLFDGKASYFQDSNIVWLEPIDKHLIYNKIYLYIVLSNLSWHELSSTTIKRIYSKDLLSKKWPIPCIEEQNKIASLFVLLDRKITLFSQRLQSLKKLKQGFMQHMFV